MAGPDQTNPVGQSQPPDGNDNANNQNTDTTQQNQHSILEGGIATRTHNHLPISSNGTMNHDKLTRMNDMETPHGPDATLGIRPPIGVGIANGNAADIVPGTNDKSYKTQKETTCMLTGPDTTSIQGDDALVHASQAPPHPLVPNHHRQVQVFPDNKIQTRLMSPPMLRFTSRF
jgi:hypothetical protein